MTSTSLIAVLKEYPEKSPFDWDPMLHNVSPPSRQIETETDTPEFIAAALAQARVAGVNPLWTWYGTNPLTVFDPYLQDADLPITAYKNPPPLPEADLSSGVSFIEQMNDNGNTPIFKVRVGNDIRVMKVFPDMDPDEEIDPSPEARGLSMVRFRREKEAYAHLLHLGACEKGAVPMCYGWTELPRHLVAELSDRFRATNNPGALLPMIIAMMKRHKRLPKALFLEYISDAIPLSVLNVNDNVAKVTLQTLANVHACYVKHNDVNTRNILVIPDRNRVVWIDFDNALCYSPEKPDLVRRQDLLWELAEGWSLLYGDLLPDKRIGFKSWIY